MTARPRLLICNIAEVGVLTSSKLGERARGGVKGFVKFATVGAEKVN